MYIVRRRISLPSEKAMFLFVNKVLPTTRSGNCHVSLLSMISLSQGHYISMSHHYLYYYILLVLMSTNLEFTNDNYPRSL